MQKTIVALATASARSSVAIIRVSGSETRRLVQAHLHRELKHRMATYCPFFEENGKKIDQGLALFFCGPHSLTGEDVWEFQGHGSPILVQKIVAALIKHPNVRMAHPGEFLKRAFLNGKIDLTQAEAIADLISADSEAQIEAAQVTADGGFGQAIRELHGQLLSIRVSLEAHIDFLDQELSHAESVRIHQALALLIQQAEALLKSAKQAVRLRDGFEVVLGGLPNAGKSSLFNRLLGHERALVTPVAGTTRDTIREPCFLEGMPIYLTDTAGIRDSEDLVEQLGVDRSLAAFKRANAILWVIDQSDPHQIAHFSSTNHQVPGTAKWLEVQFPHALKWICFNKIDSDHVIRLEDREDGVWSRMFTSARSGQGIESLKQRIAKDLIEAELQLNQRFLIRERCRDALQVATYAVQAALRGLTTDALPLDCIANELSDAQRLLGEIIGSVTNEQLLDAIFSTFCLGK